MEIKRKPFQGVSNIIRFNWHFYLIASWTIVAIFLIKIYLPSPIQWLINSLLIIVIAVISISIFISYYIYDFSGLYQLKWLPDLNKHKSLNITAGFDETSELIKNNFKTAELLICDFYDHLGKKEISIIRARKAYPPNKDSISISTTQLDFKDNSFDHCIAILAAHEIRAEQDRILLFKELYRITKSTGTIFITEHLRDWKNFMAYNIGFLHFHSKASWLNTFSKSGFKVKQEMKSTPFITTFILEKDGTTT